MHHEKGLNHQFGHGDAGKNRTVTLHGHDHVKYGCKHNVSCAHSFGTPIRTVSAKHEDVHGAKGLESHGGLSKSHASHPANASFGKSSGHAGIKTDTGHNKYRPTV